MDVRCERCKTDYEFDDARITEIGVTVKCTTCGHVFKVKKKALVVTVPVKPGELDGNHAQLTQPPVQAANAMGSERPSGEKPKEWKVRQANGNVFTFKELTTLQKWIVERKVARDDEISLTGESWKRLGNIAELASFFQVVEDAQKVQQMTAMQSLGAVAPLMTPSGGYVQPASAFGPSSGGHVQTQPQMAVVQAQIPAPQTQPQMPISQLAPAPPQISVTVNGNGAMPAEPAFARERSIGPGTQELVAQSVKKSGGGALTVILVLLLIGGLGGGGYVGYFQWWLPQEQAKLAAARNDAGREQKLKDDAAEKTKDDADKQKQVAVTPPPVVDAGTTVAAKTDDGEVLAAKGEKHEHHDFNWYMAQGDRLREREKAEAALDAYGKAADLEPDRAEPIAGRGLALLDMGSKLQAEAAFEQALKLNSRYGVAVIGLAEAFKAQGKNADALQWYQKYVEDNPTGSEANVAKEAIKKLQE